MSSTAILRCLGCSRSASGRIGLSVPTGLYSPALAGAGTGAGGATVGVAVPDAALALPLAFDRLVGGASEDEVDVATTLGSSFADEGGDAAAVSPNPPGRSDDFFDLAAFFFLPRREPGPDPSTVTPACCARCWLPTQATVPMTPAVMPRRARSCQLNVSVGILVFCEALRYVLV